MTENKEKKPKCRSYGRALLGSPYYTGKPAFHPETKQQLPSNYYGGWVCSYECDRRASFEQESSFPRAGKALSLSSGASQKLKINWN